MDNYEIEYRKLYSQLVSSLMKPTEKYLARHQGKESQVVLNALQNAAIVNMTKTLEAIALLFSDMTSQLNFIEKTRDDVNRIFDLIKTNIKSVEFH